MTNWVQYKITKINDTRLTWTRFVLDNAIRYNDRDENRIYFKKSCSSELSSYKVGDQVEIDLDRVRRKNHGHEFEYASIIRASVHVRLEEKKRELRELTDAAKRKLSVEAHYLLDIFLEDRAEITRMDLRGMARTERIRDSLSKKLDERELEAILRKQLEVSKLELEHSSDNTHEARIEISLVNDFIYRDI